MHSRRCVDDILIKDGDWVLFHSLEAVVGVESVGLWHVLTSAQHHLSIALLSGETDQPIQKLLA